MDLPALLSYAKRVGGSDLHLSADAPAMLRQHGATHKLSSPGSERPLRFDGDTLRRLLFDVLNETQQQQLEEHKELDFALSLAEGTRFRGNIFFQSRGIAAVFRVISSTIPSFEKLGLPEVVQELTTLEKGLVLVTGPTGSGKSTTLAVMLDEINRTRNGHIITIEDPIEFVHPPRACMVNQRELGVHTLSFNNALRAALREDPDVILVGEMRDLETISLAITCAETGHLVLSTLHTQSAAQTVERIVNVFPSGEQDQIRAQFAGSLQAIISQVLLEKIGGGRCAAFEILIATPAVRALIREGKTVQIPSAIQTGRKYGMCSLEQSLTRLAAARKITQEVADVQLASLGLSRKRLAPEPAEKQGSRARTLRKQWEEEERDRQRERKRLQERGRGSLYRGQPLDGGTRADRTEHVLRGGRREADETDARADRTEHALRGGRSATRRSREGRTQRKREPG